MNVGQRINARKIVLWYYYQHCFFSKLENNDIALKDVLDVCNIFPSQERYKKEKESLMREINLYANGDDWRLDIEYYVRIFFDKWKVEDIDMDYLFSVGISLHKYRDELIAKVNKYITTFSYDKMDTMHQSLFLLGYVEWKVLDTPKEVLLNEMIELWKRYADEGATKLINGIMHKILSE